MRTARFKACSDHDGKPRRRLKEASDSAAGDLSSAGLFERDRPALSRRLGRGIVRRPGRVITGGGDDLIQLPAAVAMIDRRLDPRADDERRRNREWKEEPVHVGVHPIATEGDECKRAAQRYRFSSRRESPGPDGPASSGGDNGVRETFGSAPRFSLAPIA